MKGLRLLLACLLAFAPIASLAAEVSPVGRWQDEDGLTLVEVSMCGDGTQLCAMLISVRGEARTPENLALLNGFVVKAARPVKANKWRGTVHFNGNTAMGSITVLGRNAIELSGCKLGICKSFSFTRI